MNGESWKLNLLSGIFIFIKEVLPFGVRVIPKSSLVQIRYFCHRCLDRFVPETLKNLMRIDLQRRGLKAICIVE